MEPVKYTKEQSSLISQIQYDESTWVLDVYFHNGNAYSYSDVGPEVYAEMMKADSKGSFYNRNIKGRYESLNHRDLPAEMPESEPKVIEGTFKEQLKASVEEPERDPSWPPEDVMDVIMGSDALETAGGAKVEPEVVQPEVALVTVGPLTEVMGQLSGISARLAVFAKKSALLVNRKFLVTDRASYDEVQATVKTIKAHGAEIASVIDPVRNVFYKAYDAVQTRQKESLEPLNLAMKTANAALNAYDDLKAAEARERQRKADEAAAAESERLRQAESQRLTLAAVDDNLAAGDTVAAEKLFDDPIEAPAQPVYAERVYTEAPEVKGVSKRKNWKSEIVDLEALIVDVAAGIQHMKEHGNLGGHAPANFLQANTTAVNQACKALEANARFPGVRSFNDAVRATRA